jgi:pyruvate/2-oxoglutarate dehydrogenase complex dihydrolipoamide acyltransferase (E2) component
VAVDTGNGLITPIVTAAERKGLAEISASVKEMAGRAKDGKLLPHEFMGGTITVSNLVPIRSNFRFGRNVFGQFFALYLWTNSNSKSCVQN